LMPLKFVLTLLLVMEKMLITTPRSSTQLNNAQAMLYSLEYKTWNLSLMG